MMTTASPQNPENDAGGLPGRSEKMKRTLTPDNFFRTVGNVLASGPVLIAALFRAKTSAALREKITWMLQKPRRPQIRGVRGEAVYVYREPWRTKEMRPHTAFPEGKKQGGI